MMMYHQTKFGCQEINSSEKKKSYFDHMSPSCDLDLEDSKHFFLSFCLTLWLMMLHHHSKFGNKMFCDSNVSSGETFTDN